MSADNECSCDLCTGADSLRTALRDLDALAGQDKGGCPRCNDSGVATDGDVERCECGAGTSPYSPDSAPTRGHVVLDDDGEV